MADLAAIHNVGESIAQLLQKRRALLAAENRLGPVAPNESIQHIGLNALSAAAAPTAGVAITCYHIGYSDHAPTRVASRNPDSTNGISLELSYVVSSWSGNHATELANISWAMLELSRFPSLDRSLLANPASWGRDEVIQIAPDNPPVEQLFRLWDAIKLKYRACALFKARVIRIGYGPSADAIPVIASRLSFAHGDPSDEMALT